MDKTVAGTLVGIALGAGGMSLLPNQTKVDAILGQYCVTKDASGHYKHAKGADYEVTEYYTPDGEAGCQLVYSDNTATYSVATGPEATQRSFIIPKIASSTP